jgi:hypothetical protein
MVQYKYNYGDRRASGMGHYMNVLVENGEQAKFPSIESSIIPLVWLRKKIGSPEFVIMYTQDDIPTLKYIASSGSDYERQIANDILDWLSTNENVTVSIELSNSAGGTFNHMFDNILPYSAEFKGNKWKVSHDYTTVRIV